MAEVTETAGDGVARTARDTSMAVVVLSNENLPWQVSDVDVAVGPESLRVSWNPHSRPDLAGYRLLWTESGSSWTDTLDIGRQTQHLLSSLKNDATYDVQVQAYDIEGLVGPPQRTGQRSSAPSPGRRAATADSGMACRPCGRGRLRRSRPS